MEGENRHLDRKGNEESPECYCGYSEIARKWLGCCCLQDIESPGIQIDSDA